MDITGTDDNDTLTGTSGDGADTTTGSTDNEVIGGGGNDTIIGGLAGYSNDNAFRWEIAA